MPDTELGARDAKCGSRSYGTYRLGLRRQTRVVVPVLTLINWSWLPAGLCREKARLVF